MEIVKRNGTLEPVQLEKILNSVQKACRGLQNVEALEIAKRTIHGIHNQSTTRELDQLSISNAVMLMAEEPIYSKVAARLLAESIRKEAGRDSSFREFITTAFEVGLLSSQVYELTESAPDKIEEAIQHEQDDLFEYFGLKTVADRYLLRHPATRQILERPQWLFMRVSLGLSKTVDEAIEFYRIISSFSYMPSTPTLFNSGTRHPQMSSCYLLTVQEDSLEGIYKSLADCAKLSKFSGGIGIDWTPVRASGSLIKGTNGLSNGIIPFLKVFDSSVHAVNQGGKRKGAAAVYLEPWHADIESFLELRLNTGSEERRTHHLNLALWIPDLFMKRVESDLPWSLFSPHETGDLCNCYGEEFEKKYEAYEAQGKAFKQVPARSLYAKMMQSLAETGNGWMCFKDHSNRRSAQTGQNNNVIHSSNLCTEILEVTSPKETAVCNLGSVNLSMFVTPQQTFDFERLQKTVRKAVVFLDRVVDINFYPTPEAKASNSKWRPVGLGLMGLQDALFKLRIPFDTQEARAFSSRVSETIYYEAVSASLELAQESGSFPGFRESRYPEGGLQTHLAERFKPEGSPKPTLHFDWNELSRRVSTQGIRNSLLIAIAPTATIASIVGSYESIEPQISNFFKRETLSGEFIQINPYLVADLKKKNLWNSSVRSQIIDAEGSIQSVPEIPEELKSLYKTVWEIPQKTLVEMAAERSSFICQSQSLNLFMENPTIGKLSSMYMYVWKQGLKTAYYVRSRARTKIQKTTTHAPEKEQAVSCSLENPESCEACQ